MRLLLIFFLFNYLFMGDTPVQNSYPVQLRAGEQAGLGPVVIKFKEVLSDSRCPKGVSCIWAGEAKVLVSIYKNNCKLGEEILILANVGGEYSEINNDIPGMDLLKIRGKLQPYPEVGEKISEKDYFLFLQLNDKAEGE